MKKLFTFIITVTLGLSLFTACKKEELVVVNEPLELDENSPQYQEYMIERAINLIELFRFDKLGNTIDRIKDPAKKAEILAMLDEYRNRARNEAWYYVTPESDTLYFFPPVEGSRLEAKNSFINFTPLFLQFPWQKQIVNVKGILHGMGIFPNLEEFGATNCLATGIKDVDQMPNLKSFSWTFLADYLPYFFPDLVLEPFPFEVDFSNNDKLENLILEYADISKLKFPATKLKTFSLSTGIINENDVLEGLSANNVGIVAASAKSDMVLKAKNIDSLNISTTLASFDISESNILKLEARAGIKKLKLNSGLKKLILDGRDLTESPSFPVGLEELILDSYTLQGSDLRSFSDLKYVSLNSGGGLNKIDLDGWKLPQNMQRLSLSGSFDGTFDFSSFSGLSEARFDNLRDGQSVINTTMTFPPNVQSLWCTGSISGKVDLSQITNLKQFYFSEYQPFLGDWGPLELILPVNITEDQVAQWNYGNPVIYARNSTLIVNAPEWMNKYIVRG